MDLAVALMVVQTNIILEPNEPLALKLPEQKESKYRISKHECHFNFHHLECFIGQLFMENASPIRAGIWYETEANWWINSLICFVLAFSSLLTNFTFLFRTKGDEEMLVENHGTGLGEQLNGHGGGGDGQKEPGADGAGQDNPEDDQNYQFYKEYCRLYYANIILTNRL